MPEAYPGTLTGEDLTRLRKCIPQTGGPDMVRVDFASGEVESELEIQMECLIGRLQTDIPD